MIKFIFTGFKLISFIYISTFILFTILGIGLLLMDKYIYKNNEYQLQDIVYKLKEILKIETIIFPLAFIFITIMSILMKIIITI